MSEQGSISDSKYELHSNMGSIKPKTPFLEEYGGPLTLIGGACVHLVLGTFYLWGAIAVYVASYLREFDDSVTISRLLSLPPLTVVAMNVGIFVGVPLTEKVGARIMLIVGICAISLSVFVASFAQSFTFLAGVYGFVFGFFNGTLYMLPVMCGWKFYPNNKGLVSGITIGAFGFGAFIFNFVATGIVNPDDLSPSIVVGHEKYFGPEVADRVPKLFKVLSVCYICLGLIGALLIRIPKKQEQAPSQTLNDNETQELVAVRKEVEVSVRDGVLSKQFWLLFIMAACGSSLGLLLASNYKVYGSDKINDDHFLTLIGSFGSVANGSTRAVWALLFDKFGFRKVYFALLTIQAVLAPTIQFISGTKALYLIWYCLIMSCEGGHFAMFPSVTAKVFGLKNGPKIYSYMFWCFAVSNWLGLFEANLAINHYGWNAIFYVAFALTLIPFICNIFFKEEFTKKQK